jgi:hypothetical protein
MPTQRHTLTADPEWLREAREAVDGFVAGLQAVTDSADAETYNADFAEDVSLRCVFVPSDNYLPPLAIRPHCRGALLSLLTLRKCCLSNAPANSLANAVAER